MYYLQAMTTAAADDLLAFLAAAPTPYHAVAEARRRLDAAGARVLDEGEDFALARGELAYVVRGGTSLVAVRVGTSAALEHGFRLIGAHTDSPNLRVKPNADVSAAGVAQLAVEPYGGVLLYTWLDRDLGLAGRVFTREGGRTVASLVRADEPLLRIPSLAIHLQRGVNTDGLVVNAQRHLPPVYGLAAGNDRSLRELLGRHVEGEIVAFDLMLTDLQPPSCLGHAGAFVSSGRLDNLASCHAALAAMIGAGATPATQVVALFDHEEVGSRSAQGAQSNLLRDVLSRVLLSEGADRTDALPRAAARSFFVSADMAHALHPNHVDRHEPGHAPLLGGGPVVKCNVNQSYATDGEGFALFEGHAAAAGVPTQRFVTRSDLGCGSTIGPMAAAALGVRTVDVGLPMLAMHSARELCAADDVPRFVAVLEAFLAGRS